MTRKLLAAFKIFPVFLNFLHAFGTTPDLAFGGCKHRIYFSTLPQSSAAWDLSSYEICYNFKSVFPRPGKKPPHHWTIDQTAVYQKFTFDKRQNVWILVVPAESVRKRMEHSFESHSRHSLESSHRNPLEPHLLFISAAAENWGAYFHALEKEFVDLTIEAVEINVGKPLGSNTFNSERVDEIGFVAEFRRLQILQHFKEHVQLYKASVEINEDTIRSLQTLNTTLRDYNSDPTAKITWHCVDAALEQQLADISRHKRNIEGLLLKIQGRSQLMYNVLEHQTALHVADLAEKREIDREKTIAMNEKTVRDTVGVKIMTVVALLYLPATFVAVSLRKLVT
ncbi:hypothetical protein K440DRAFT_159332 [Wilcoxina mikolae CBS 423.85]|nr:hypothetical protein K440DRAFT_159332 [Wilcoxina mikolae CBS 423.85]